MPQIRNILIIRLSAIGDVIHVLPCLHALRRAYPRARIGWLVEELSAPLLKGHPEIDELHIIPKKRWRQQPLQTWFNGEKRVFYANLRKTRWDVALDFQGLTKSGWPAWLSGAPQRIGFGGVDSREINRIFINKKVVPSESARHVIQRNLSLLQPLGIENPDVIWRFPDLSAERLQMAPFLNSLETPGNRFIALNPGAGWETKRWPPEHFVELAKSLAMSGQDALGEFLPMVLIWGPAEENLCAEIIKQAGLPDSLLKMAPPTNLRQLTVLLKQAAAIVGGDTGPIHLAAALGVPVVGIYGASDPARNGPWGKGHAILQADSSCCAACWRTRCNNENRLACLRTLKPKTAADAVQRILLAK